VTLPDIDSFLTTYGGVKSDAAMPVLDPVTDRSAAGANSALLTIAALTHTVARAYVTITLSATPKVLLTRGKYDAVWGRNLVPTVTYVGVGHSTVTFPTTTLDASGGLHVVNVRWARSIPGLGVPFAQPTITGLNTVDLFYGTSGGPSDFTNAFSIRLEVG
jgi:hypothetical protein